MRTRRIAPVIAALTVLYGPSSFAAPAGCLLRGVGTIDVQTQNGALTVEAQVNGRPVHLVVDTGSELTLLFQRDAKALGLTVKSLEGVDFYGATGKESSGMANVKEFKLANLMQKNIEVAVVGGFHSSDAQGLLGAYFLLQDDVEFDLAAKKIRFFKPENCNGSEVIYWGGTYSVTPMLGPSNSRKIMVGVKVNGQRLTAQMDTGASTSILTTPAAERAGLKATSPGVVANGPIEPSLQSFQTYVGLFPSFSFGDETIKNARLKFSDIFSANTETHVGSIIPEKIAINPDMLLGADFFKAHRVYVAMSQRKVYVSYIGGPVFQTRDQPSATK